MRLIEGLDALQQLDLRAAHGDTPQGHCVVAVGVFDGVHLGHQRLLHELQEMASTLAGVPTVVTFRNHPDQLLRGDAPPLLVSVDHRLRLLRRAGVHRLVLLDFEPRLMQMTAREFADELLVTKLRTRGLLLGYDSALGRNREGTPQRFAELGAELGFIVQTGRPLVIDGETISSTTIRTAIANGDLERARRLLGRWPSTFGSVVHGDGRGRTLGFPTANVAAQTPVLPPAGVYAVEVILDGKVRSGIANLGVRPTFDGDDSAVLEVYIFDFEADLYGRELEVCFLQHIRDEQRFENAEALREQIGRDIAQARARLS